MFYHPTVEQTGKNYTRLVEKDVTTNKKNKRNDFDVYKRTSPNRWRPLCDDKALEGILRRNDEADNETTMAQLDSQARRAVLIEFRMRLRQCNKIN
jgi:hypothetical protein